MGTDSDRAQKLTITLIGAARGCAKCDQCEAMVRAVQARHRGSIELRKVSADSPQAEEYGLVMPPMLIVGDFIAAAGRVPAPEALEELVVRMLGPEVHG